jgi:hypothetical protein
MLKLFVEEAAALASITLFVGMIAVWAQLIPQLYETASGNIGRDFGESGTTAGKWSLRRGHLRSAAAPWVVSRPQAVPCSFSPR